MKILALDLATRTGWALGDSARYESGAETFDLRRGESPGMRYLRFSRWLDEVLTAELDLVVYEQPFIMRSGMAAEIALGFATRVQQRCAVVEVPHAAPNGMTLKKWTTGSGRAGKPEMLEAVARRWRRVDDHNEADAVALLHYAFAELIPRRA
jgi:Holliday junction resolvasome RuvABC endonuclease subunit